MKTHPAADIFPPMSEAEYAGLRADIAAHGVREPITTWRGLLIDGRHRERACSELGIDCPAREWEGEEGEVDAFVISLNSKRRDLTPSQRAMVALAFEARAAEAAKRRMLTGKAPDPTETIPQGKGEARVEAGALVGVNPHYVTDAKTVMQKAPELAERVRLGEVTLPAAMRSLRGPAVTPPAPEGEFSVILSDPPWRYDFSATDSRKIENQYPTMEVGEICALGKTMPFAANSVLLLWATAPKLLQAIEVMTAWRFDYVTHGVWDKEIIGMGYWFRGQHELLLIGTRGKFPPPPESARISSMIRSKRERHSGKPVAVYEWIEAAYPDAAKLELFQRETRSGWTGWGNEVADAA